MLVLNRPRPLAELAAEASAALGRQLAVLGAPDQAPAVTLAGDGGVRVTALSAAEESGPGCLTFAVAAPYLKRAEEAGAAAVILPPALAASPLKLPALVTAEPRLLFSVCLALAGAEIRPGPAAGEAFFVDRATVSLGPGVILGQGAHIGRGVRLGARTVVGPRAFLDDGVVVGEDCLIHPLAVLRWGVRVGDRCQIHSGAVIGDDGFGYSQLPTPDGRLIHFKNEHQGGVVLEDDVEIGAQAAVDRGLVADTVVGRGTKIDNLAQIGHNVRLGRDCLVVAQAGLGGHAVLGDRVFLLGQVGVGPGVTIGDDAILTAQTGVGSGRVPAGRRAWSGSPLKPHEEQYQTLALMSTQLPKVRRFFQALKKSATLEELKSLFFSSGEKENP
ncbi:MAG: UDP-3-O-(3-hydroxymyristoyl)glucosamine N-acyltransferase [Candidatus Adiutrix sp.]|jgi:UDP-3-O-[3-hydroxymyristoyl] glucosamine N-acyltransferase|nr:UDP-3-O-(3-hydroxymyristoyl)glucosamine N-acyltransferase [Candidatus Adiutrix sp.]